MSMGTNLKGRLRNTNLPLSHVLMPLFEAVVNSIHAIEDAGISPAEGQICIEVIRDDDKQLSLSSDIQSPQGVPVVFRITDNGVGFTDRNMESFNELDSQYKQERGGRGMGRLLWLKAFQRVTVESVFRENEALYRRSFDFDENNGVCNEKPLEVKDGACCGSTVILDGLREKYRKAIPKKSDTIARDIFEHCIGYFLRPEGAPNIIVQDKKDSVSLQDIYAENLLSSLITEKVELKGQPFEITHVRFRKCALTPKVHFCAAQRSVRTLDLEKKIAGFFGKLEDGHGEFNYVCYVTSPFLEDNLLSERMEFGISEEKEGLFQDTELSFEEIDAAVLGKVEQHLFSCLEASREECLQRVYRLVETELPQYRSILKNAKKEELYFKPSATSQEIEVELFKIQSDLDRQLLEQGQDILNSKGDSNEEYQKKFEAYLQLAGDLKQSELAKYVVRRRVILDFLKTYIERMGDGSYAKESAIHRLILPMGKDSEELTFYDNNLWVIDERLVFYHYLSSDKPLSSMPITGSDSLKRPDVLKLDLFDNPTWIGSLSSAQATSPASLTVIEFKRPMRDDAQVGEEQNPVEQVLNYLKLIRDGKVKSIQGRPIYNAEDIPAFCYIICDLTASIQRRCDMHNLTLASDKRGYFGYISAYKAYIEVISYDKLLWDAFQRNQAFFEKLGLPTAI